MDGGIIDGLFFIFFKYCHDCEQIVNNNNEILKSFISYQEMQIKIALTTHHNG